MLYPIIVLILFVLMLIYFKVADKYNIVDKPNERSSHTVVTLRGGGIIFWFAALIYFVLHIETSYLFFTAITLVSFISFYDDIKSLPNKVRLTVQLLAMTAIFYDLNLFELLPWWAVGVSYVFALGIVNAYNFMDGINGITGLYTIAVMLPLLLINSKINFIDADLIIYPILANIVFLFFNYRKKAKCFAGDVGSISIALWVIYLLGKLMVETDSIIWIMFLAVYGVDTICTIIHRLYLKQNIFQAHRLHFYQILSNEKKMDHRVVSLIYALVQLVISLAIVEFFHSEYIVPISIGLILLLVGIYQIKFKLKKQIA